MPQYILVLTLCALHIFAQSSCEDWIMNTDELTYESLNNALNEKVEIPIKLYERIYP